jgi:hypothetical protein
MQHGILKHKFQKEQIMWPTQIDGNASGCGL